MGLDTKEGHAETCQGCNQGLSDFVRAHVAVGIGRLDLAECCGNDQQTVRVMAHPLKTLDEYFALFSQ